MLENEGFFAGFLQARKRLTPLKSAFCALLMINERQLVKGFGGVLRPRSGSLKGLGLTPAYSECTGLTYRYYSQCVI